MIQQLLLTILIVVTSASAVAQQDFNQFRTLVSSGAIPADFSTQTYNKIETDLSEHRTGLSSSQERIFLEGIHYSIDQILQSNMIIYGDEISVYVKEVAAHLLKDQPELLAKLRFYTLKSNETNALSTDQGIIFVTTGLISQLTTEAQLAYILAHEISHYTEKHVVETFEWKSNNSHRQISQLSIYSKDKEFEADRIAIALYSKAGYSKSEIPVTFDVLMYSYLPFDEIELPKTYFNTPMMYVPESLFPVKKYEIKANEDFDDENSSHPNIRKRKEAAQVIYDAVPDWQDSSYALGPERFQYVRNLARFESIRTDVINAAFTKALYSIFLLERDFPQSLYLQRMKAQCWLGIAQFKKNANSEPFRATANNEGEIAAMHQFIKKLDVSAASVVALRIIYDLKQQTGEDLEISAVYDRMVKTCALSTKFNPELFSSKTFEEASTVVIVPADTSAAVIPTGEQAKHSKYDRIRQKKSPETTESFDSTKFYLYAISDIVRDPAFLALYKSHKAEQDKEQADKDAFALLSSDERKKVLKLEKKNQFRMGINDLILVEPSVVDYKHGEIDHIKSEKLEEKLTVVIEDVSKHIDMNISTISSLSMQHNGTVDFNDRSVLFTGIEQSTVYTDLDFFPVDYLLMREMESRRKKSNVMFLLAEHRYKPDLRIGWMLYSFLIFPTFPFTVGIYVPQRIIKGHDTEISYLILNLNKGQVTLGESILFHEQFYKHNLGAHMYSILSLIKSQPLTK